jgi:Amt family ammonium transporter
VVGYAFSFGGAPEGSTETTFIGTENFFLIDTEDYAFFAYNSAFAAATVTIVAGTLAGMYLFVRKQVIITLELNSWYS